MNRRPAILGAHPAFPEGLPLVRPTLPDVPGIARALESVLGSGMLTNSASVLRLEEAAATYLDVRNVVAVSSCTTGLMLVLQALGIRGRVLVPSFTFSATAHAIHWAGGTPDWADIDPTTLTLDPASAAAGADEASALMAVHLYGTPCDVERLQKLADAARIPLVFDAAHALGSRRRQRPVGGFGTAEVFSLSPTKVVVAGEGGLVATNDDGLAETVRIGRDYGNPGDYDCLFPGLNARMSELHATIGLASLQGLDTRVSRRNELVARFRNATRDLPGLTFPTVDPGDVSTYKDLTLLIDAEAFGLGPQALGAALRHEGIDSRRYYHPPVHRQQAYAGKPPRRPLPITDHAAARVLSPPLWSHMTDQQIDHLASAIETIHTHADPVARALLARP
ncbi:MAG: DegT/DnrJ/EryC1/StrS family aminotransferase [Egibacteraceae bacterium]